MRLIALLALVLLNTTACARLGPLRAASVGQPVTMSSNRFAVRMPAAVGDAVLFGVMADIHAKGKIARAGPVELDDQLELVAVRAHFVGRTRPGVFSLNGSVGSWCEPYKITGYGPTYDATGLEVEPGDKVGFILYLRPKENGTFMSQGWRIAFTGAFGRKVYDRPETANLTLTVGPGCQTKHHNIPQSTWTGGPDATGHCLIDRGEKQNETSLPIATCRPGRRQGSDSN